MTRAVEFARFAPRQRDDLASTYAAEVPQSGVSHEPGRADDHHLLVCHFVAPKRFLRFYLAEDGGSRESAGGGARLSRAITMKIPLYRGATGFVCEPYLHNVPRPVRPPV